MFACIMSYECLIGTSRSPGADLTGLGRGAEMVRTPSRDKAEVTCSGFTPRGSVKLWLKLCVAKLRPSDVFSSFFASTTTVLSTVLI